jgi:hypothetical protein
MQAVVRLVLLALGALLLVAPVTAGAPAAAIEQCEEFDLADPAQLREKLTAVDTVFEGRVVDLARGETATGEVRFVHAVRVRTGYAGDLVAGDRVEVITYAGADNGMGRLQADTRYLFFAQSQGDGTVLVDACNGTTSLEGALHAAQVALIETLVEEEAKQAALVAFEEPADGVPAVPSLLRLAGPGAALAVLGLVALLLVIAIGARRPT